MPFDILFGTFTCTLHKPEELQILTVSHCAALISTVAPLLYFWNKANKRNWPNAGRPIFNLGECESLFFYVLCTLHFNIIMQHKPTNCAFSKLLFKLRCLLYVLNPTVNLQEEGCIYSYSMLYMLQYKQSSQGNLFILMHVESACTNVFLKMNPRFRNV